MAGVNNSGSGGAAGAIRAGRAFVQLFAEDSEVLRALDRLKSRFQTFGTFVAKIGVATGGVGAAVAAGFKPALDALNEQSAIGDLAEGFNLSAEKASRLFGIMAAGGSDIRDAQEGLLTFNKLVNDALTGSGEEAKNFFKELGVGAADFAQLDTADRFYKLRDAINASKSPLGKLGLLGKAFGEDTGKNLKGVLAITAAQIGELGDAFQTSAVDIEAARGATRAQTLATALLGKVYREVATAIAPSVKEFAETVQKNVGPVIEWVRANREVVATVLRIATAATFVGAALVGLGGVLHGVSTAVTGAIFAFKAVGLIMAAIVSPTGLVIAALAGLGYAFVTQTETGAAAFAFLKAGFLDVAEQARESWGGIVAAVRKGDLGLAAEIATTTLELAWAKTMEKMTGAWNRFKGVFVDGWHEATDGVGAILREMWNVANEVFGGIRKTVRETVAEIGAEFEGVGSAIVQALSVIGPVIGPILAALFAPLALAADLAEEAWNGTSNNLAETLNNLASFTEKSFVRVSASIENMFKAAARVVLDTAISAAEALDSLDPTSSLAGAIGKLKELRAGIAAAADPTAEVAAIEAKRKAFEDELRAKRAEAETARKAGRADDEKRAAERAAEIKVKLDALIGEAGKPGIGRGATSLDQELRHADFGGAVASASTVSGSRGSFTAANAAQRFGSPDAIPKQQLKVAEQQLDVQKDIVKGVAGIANGLRFK